MGVPAVGAVNKRLSNPNILECDEYSNISPIENQLEVVDSARNDADLCLHRESHVSNGLVESLEDDDDDGKTPAAVNLGRMHGEPLTSSPVSMTLDDGVKVSPVIKDLKLYLEWFSKAYRPGIQLGRNKPESKMMELQLDNSVIDQQTADAELTSSGESPTPSTEEMHAVLERVSSAMTSDAAHSATDEFILRELADIRRVLLQRFLIQHNNDEGGGGGDNERNAMNLVSDPESENDLFEILGALTDEIGSATAGASSAAAADFPVGEWTWAACQVCLERRWLHKRACCGLPVCNECLKMYFSIKVSEGVVKIECCNSKCKTFVHRDEISARLGAFDKQKFYQFLADVNCDPLIKTCPRCSHLTVFAKVKPSHLKNTKKYPVRSRLVCPECNLTWCFNCHAPWHPGFTCRQYRKGDRLMKSWANEIHHGQLNAQKCPRCQVYIQRTTGCDHMHCTRCRTDFCYRCGDRLRKLRFFGDHYSKLSVFGCKYRYKADKPLQRKLIRGAVFGSKLMAAPILGTLGACAGVIALGFGIFILPVYGGVRLYQKLSNRCEQPIF